MSQINIFNCKTRLLKSDIKKFFNKKKQCINVLEYTKRKTETQHPSISLNFRAILKIFGSTY